MIKRHTETELLRLLEQFPAVAILGPRQKGREASRVKRETVMVVEA